MDIMDKWIGPLITLILAGAAVVFGYGRTNQRFDLKIKSLDDAVFLSDGKWRFASSDEVCKKLDTMDEKIDEIRTVQTSDMKEIANFMGKVEQALKERQS